MRYLALCCDYDGTLATHGQVQSETVLALERVRASGRRVVLVTGRELNELVTVAPPLDLFDLVVAENGALLFDPATGSEQLLGRRPPDAFVAALRALGVTRISVGRVIIATWEPHSATVERELRKHGLDHQVILNKGAVMVLPAGVNKGTGLAAALPRLGLSPHNAVGIGDAENDEALLSACECGVAVANALPSLKERADFTTESDHGAGVAELCAELLNNDLEGRELPLARLGITIGHDTAGGELRIAPYSERLLLLGAPRDTHALVEALREQLAGRGYTSLLLTPHRHGSHAQAVHVLDGAEQAGQQPEPQQPPVLAEILDRLETQDGQQVEASLAGLPPAQLAPFLAQLFAQLAPVTARCGRPHWILMEEVDELARHLPLAIPRTCVCTAQQLDGFALQAMSEMTLLIAIGEPRHALVKLCGADSVAGPDTGSVAWRPGSGAPLGIRLAHTAPAVSSL